MKIINTMYLLMALSTGTVMANNSTVIYDSGDRLEKVQCGKTYCPEITKEQKERELTKAGFASVMCIYYSDYGYRYGLRCVGHLPKQENRICAEVTKQLIKAARNGEVAKVEVLSQILADNNCDKKKGNVAVTSVGSSSMSNSVSTSITTENKETKVIRTDLGSADEPEILKLSNEELVDEAMRSSWGSCEVRFDKKKNKYVLSGYSTEAWYEKKSDLGFMLRFKIKNNDCAI